MFKDKTLEEDFLLMEDEERRSHISVDVYDAVTLQISTRDEYRGYQGTEIKLELEELDLLIDLLNRAKKQIVGAE